MIEKIKRQQSVSAPVTGAKAVAPPGRVLLVEDDRSLRRYLEVVLRREGYEVMVAVDGLEAMRVTLTQPVDVVVTDAIMPNLNGHELIRFLRNTPQLADMPVVLLSALATQDSSNALQQADACLSKPVSPKALVECIENLLEDR